MARIASLLAILLIGAVLVSQWSMQRDLARTEALKRREVEAEVVELNKKRSALQQQLASLQRSTLDHAAESTKGCDAPDGNLTSGARSTGKSMPVSRAPAKPADGELIRARAKVDVQSAYMPLIRSLNLDERQQGELIQLLIADEMKRRTPEEDDAGAEPQTDVSLEYRVTALIGFEKGQEFRRYLESFMDQSRANQIATSLYAVGTPLSEQQRTLLAKKMIEERSTYPPPGPGESDPKTSIAKYVEWQEEYNRRVIAGLSPTIGSSQLAFIAEQFKLSEMTYREVAQQGNSLIVKPTPAIP